MSTTAEAPTFAAGSTRLSLGAVVPYDEFRVVRLALMLEFLGIYLWWLRNMGLPIDRLSVAVSVGIFLLCAFVGKTWRTWAVLLLDCTFYCLMWFAYERTRSAADEGVSVFGLFTIPHQFQVESMRNIDRALFFGHDPNTVLQDHFWERHVRWYDVVASSAYMTHFVVPIIVMAVLWAISHRQWVRFMKRFATLLTVACAVFVILPTAPPWMLGSPKYHFQLIHELHRDAGRGFRHLGFTGFANDYKLALGNGNAKAAMPSLHASFALIVPAFFLPWIRPKWLKGTVLLFPVLMLASLVYLGEHWVIDGLAGWVITACTFWFWNRMERRLRTHRGAVARSALAPATESAIDAHADAEPAIIATTPTDLVPAPAAESGPSSSPEWAPA
ncbi:MAG: phosphatase PAP2 family protein [Ilumatobacteraceae bacterium]